MGKTRTKPLTLMACSTRKTVYVGHFNLKRHFTVGNCSSFVVGMYVSEIDNGYFENRWKKCTFL